MTATEPFSELGREQLENVLDMLDGRYPSERFAELRPRVAWDRTAGMVRGRKGARQLAVTNAGTIPDRGLYGVHLPDGRRVGELDEEMVYEARPGQTFLLGATTWRIEDITRDRVIVTPAPGVPARSRSGAGDGVGRPAELGRAIGEFAPRGGVHATAKELAKDYDLDRRAAENLVAYLREQQAATRVVPSDQSIVIERFRDEIGDWRLCILSPFGGRVHAAWGLALSARIRNDQDLEADAIWSDDGIVIHLPDADEAPPADLVLLEPDEVEDLVVRELGGSALFGARFRENAARSLLLPRAYPGKRTPLWQQRLKSQSLLEVAKDFPRFPVTLETYRECLRDVLDLPSLESLLRDLHSRKIIAGRGRDAHGIAVRLVAALRLRRDVHVRGRHAQRRAPGRRPRARPRPPARAARPGGAARADRPRGPGRRRDVPPAPDRPGAGQRSRRASGDPPPARRPDPRGVRGASGRGLLSGVDARQARGRAARREGADRRRGALDRGRGRRHVPRRARRATARAGCPESFLENTPDAMEALVRRYARTHGPFPTAQLTARYGVDPTPTLRELERSGVLVRGELLPGGTEREWCDADVLRRVRRASLAHLRKEAEAVDPTRAGPLPARLAERRRAPPGRRRAGPPARGARRAAGGRADARGLGARRAAAAPRHLQPELARRALHRRRDRLDRGGTAGSHRAAWPSTSARTSAWPGRRPPTPSSRRPKGEVHDAIRERLGAGACFWLDLVAELDDSPEELHAALWDLAWAGEVTNDAFAPLRARRLSAVQRAQRGTRRFASRRAGANRAVQGRWSLTAPLFEGAPAQGPRLRAQAELMLERYGIVTRESVLAEGVPGGFSALYGELSNLEMLGTARRGYFVEGLGGAQFALAGAVERLRGLPHAEGRYLLLAATDPANPYGAALPWPKRQDRDGAGPGGRRPSRSPGAYLLMRDGEPVLYLERGGKGILRLRELESEELSEAIAEIADAAHAGLIPKLGIERIDGEAVIGSGLEGTLIAAGFSRQPRRLVASA